MKIRVRENVKTIHRLRDALRDCEKRMKLARTQLSQPTTSSDMAYVRRLLDRRRKL